MQLYFCNQSYKNLGKKGLKSKDFRKKIGTIRKSVWKQNEYNVKTKQAWYLWQSKYDKISYLISFTYEIMLP